MTDLITILSSGALSVLLSGALIFLFKNWISARIKSAIQYEYDQKLETHKARLRAQSDTAIEQFKSQLQIAAAERNLRFSHVFERTADTIATTYKKLLDLGGAVGNYTDAIEAGREGDLEAARERLNKSAQEFLTYFHPNKIYIPKKTAEKVGQFLGTLERFKSNTLRLAAAEKARLPQEQIMERFEKLEQLRADIPKLMESLHIEFQEILGFPPEETPLPAKTS